MSTKTKLELTWIGKVHRPRLEPRILIEESVRSHHAPVRRAGDQFDNLLIHGDNLLALKALEADFTGEVKCVYIDPPFNTQQAFEHYDDGLEHSLWLSLMRDRISCIHRLLSEDGSLFIHIDDNEIAYLTVICDEIFGRRNRINIVTFKQSSVSGPKVINPGLVTTSNYILYYAKEKSRWRPNKLFVPTVRDSRYGTFIEGRNLPSSDWRFVPLSEAFRARQKGGVEKSIDEKKLTRFVLDNADAVVRLARISPSDVSEETRFELTRSIENPGEVCVAKRDGREDVYFVRGEQLLFYSTKVKIIDGQKTTAQALSNIWDDLLSNNLHAEGGVRFPGGKKPEGLLKRVIELSTNEGDLVLDSFAGSGTTGATAHKLRRSWIMIEAGEQAITHIVPRLKRVIDGEDSSGITSAVQWPGGGGYRYLRLAPSLLERDQFGQWVISKAYNPEMLSEAMCKHFGFTYAPSAEYYWLHGHSSETDFIYVTTNSLTHEQLQAISEEVGDERTLLICCKAFQGTNADKFTNLTVRKIPGAVLDRCEWGKDDYSLKIEALPLVEEEPEPEAAPEAFPRSRGRPRRADDAPSLFDAESDA
jgi:adenine-specific DNA-methyltransferase